jgi:NADPH:quinone reductase-like Zn-dependent oxidoreductase
MTNGRGAEIVSDTVGGPMFEPALKSLRHGRRLLEIFDRIERLSQ